MTRIYLVRHAEAEGNLYRRIHGWYDALITDNGYRQIAALEQRFESIPIDAVYSSDLFRTKTTATAVTRPKRLPLTTVKGLREIHMGAWEDMPWGEAGYFHREDLDRFSSQSPQWRGEGGESFAEVRQRAAHALRSIAAAHPGQNVAVFSHGTTIRNALAALMGLSVEEANSLGHSDNTAVSLLEFEGDTVRVVYQDDNSHLPEEISTLARQSWWKKGPEAQKKTNLWFRPMDLAFGEMTDYLQAREEAWRLIHPTLEGFDGEGFLTQAARRVANGTGLVMRAMLEGEPVGLVELDLKQDAEKGVGWIPFCYLAPQWRDQGYGVQLIGQAVSSFRALGRDYLRLHCAPENAKAQRFYEKYGFRKMGKVPGAQGMLDVLEKYIGYKDMRE